ncbi:hypothetical protein BH11PLA1_BH11PLA1_02690 [soil metagenome]
MTIWLDDQRLAATPDASLASALAAARAAAQQTGRVIIEATWDGELISDDILADPPKTPLAQRELRFATADPRALVSATMHELGDVVQRLDLLQQEAADSLRAGDMTSALSGLSEAIEVWDTLRRAVQEGPALLGVALNDLTVRDPAGTPISLTAAIGGLSDVMNDLKAALENQDWAALGDLLDGEMNAQAKRFVGILRDLAGQLGRR